MAAARHYNLTVLRTFSGAQRLFSPLKLLLEVILNFFGHRDVFYTSVWFRDTSSVFALTLVFLRLPALHLA